MREGLRRLPDIKRLFIFILFSTLVLFLIYLLFGLRRYDTQEQRSRIIESLESAIISRKLDNNNVNPVILNVTSAVVQDAAPAVLTITLPSIKSSKPLNRKEPPVVDVSSVVDSVMQESPRVNSNAERRLVSTPLLPVVVPVVVNNQLDLQHDQMKFKPQIFTGPTNDKQREIVKAFLHGWSAYKKYAWGHDELKPLTKYWQEWMGVGLTLVDSLDTLYVMGLTNEFNEARDWVANSLNYERDTNVQLFEITIRVLGGLLSAYHLSADPVFLEKAIELGDKLEPCFHGVTAVPCNRINMKRKTPSFIEISTAEAGTIQLELTALSRAANNSKYELLGNRISKHIHDIGSLDGLVACSMNPFVGTMHTTSPASVGAGCDSFYEYLLKQWIQTGKTVDWLKLDYLAAVEGIKKHLVRYSEPSKLAFTGALSTFTSNGVFRNDLEHLACFLPGTLALGVMHGLDASHLTLAAELTRTCYELYRSQPTGLSPESVTMNLDPMGRQDIQVQYNGRYNLQRPETVESLLYMYRATGKEMYRDWGWKIFKSFEKYTRVQAGYASIDNVQDANTPGYRDKMESFYLAETLKYLYMLFSDDNKLLDLDKYVMNTEAHPLPIYSRH